MNTLLFNRAIAEYMGDIVTHIVTNSQWDDNFDEASYVQATHLLFSHVTTNINGALSSMY